MLILIKVNFWYNCSRWVRVSKIHRVCEGEYSRQTNSLMSLFKLEKLHQKCSCEDDLDCLSFDEDTQVETKCEDPRYK